MPALIKFSESDVFAEIQTRPYRNLFYSDLHFTSLSALGLHAVTIAMRTFPVLRQILPGFLDLGCVFAVVRRLCHRRLVGYRRRGPRWVTLGHDLRGQQEDGSRYQEYLGSHAQFLKVTVDETSWRFLAPNRTKRMEEARCASILIPVFRLEIMYTQSPILIDNCFLPALIEGGKSGVITLLFEL